MFKLNQRQPEEITDDKKIQWGQLKIVTTGDSMNGQQRFYKLFFNDE